MSRSTRWILAADPSFRRLGGRHRFVTGGRPDPCEVVSPVASGLQRYLPWFTHGLGLAVLAAGGWLLAGRSLPAPRRRPGGPALTRSAPAMVGFGASYALAPLTCTIGPFLAIVVASTRSGSSAEGALLFLSYAVGMGLLVGVTAVAAALARRGGGGPAARHRPAGAAGDRGAAGVLLVLVGGYVAWYGAWELRVLGGEDPADPVIDAAARVQQVVSRWVSTLAP